MPPALFAAFADPSFSLAELRLQIPGIVVGLILLIVGISAVALFLFRRKSGDLTLVYFSLFAILYALRLLIENRVVDSLAGLSATLSRHMIVWITVVILIPFLLCLRQVRRPYLDTLVNIMVSIQAVFAAFAIVSDWLGAKQRLAHSVGDYLVLIFVGLLVADFLVVRLRGKGQPWTRELRVLTAGLLVFAAFVLHGNLIDVHLLPGRSFEPLGFLFFCGCLAYIAAHRTFANEERLLSISKELEIARQIQACTLPQSVPQVAGLEIAARYLPMSQVAGDFYDFLAVDDRHLGVLIADVTGHGVPAALIASMLKVAFAEQFAHAADPARVLTGLNRSLCGKFEEHFITAAYVFVDLEKRVMRYAGAGHPPLLLVSRSDSTPRLIEENGLMLGMFPEAAYSAQEIPVTSGDRLLLYTDGAFEATNPALEEFGKPRLAQFLQSHRNLPPDGFTVALIDEISSWAGNTPTRGRDDDITLLVLDFPLSSQAPA
jgi:phosphoserine phosphatase RsbU/P